MEHTSWSCQEKYDLFINKRSVRPQDELAELLWRDGQVVLQSQTHREQTQTLTQKQDHHEEALRSNTFLEDQETVSWIQYPPDDDPFETDDFSSNFFSTVDSLQRPNSETVNPKTSPDPPQVMPPPKFRLTDSSSGIKDLGKEQCSVVTVGPSHCGSNQSQNDHDVSMSHGRSKNIEEGLYPNASSSSGGSSGCSKSFKASGSITTDCKRKHMMETDESVSQSDATGNKSSQRSGSTRRSRAAEVHNLSERRRRDRINERMKALQELIPHCTKTDKASILEEAIDYLKSLQLQLQMMWMGSGMTATASMMFPGVQTPPFIRHQMQQNPLQLSQFPVIDRSAIQNNLGLVYHNQLFSNRFARHMGGFSHIEAASQMQQMEMLRFSSPAGHQSQQPSAPTKITEGPRMDH